MKHATRIQVFTLACVLLAGGALACDRASEAEPAAAARDVPLAMQDCTARTPVDTLRYFGTAPGSPWDSVRAYMVSAGLDFDWGSSTTLAVRLCEDPANPGCRPLPLRIQSEASNVCLDQATAQDGQLRILGRLQKRGNIPGSDSAGLEWGFTPANRTSVVFLLLRGTTAYAMYDSAGVTQFAPAGNWAFNFCSDGMTAPYAQATWENFADSAGRRRRDPNEEKGKDKEEEEEEGGDEELASFGWMACVSGCCRFYGSPPPTGDPERPRGRITMPPCSTGTM